MSGWLRGLGAITLFTEDLPATRAFYADVFGLELVFEDDDSAAYRFGGATVLNLLRVEAAGELITPAPVAGPGQGARYGATRRAVGHLGARRHPAPWRWAGCRWP